MANWSQQRRRWPPPDASAVGGVSPLPENVTELPQSWFKFTLTSDARVHA